MPPARSHSSVSPSATTRGRGNLQLQSSLASRPPWSAFGRSNTNNARDDSPSTSRHHLHTTSPAARTRSPIAGARRDPRMRAHSEAWVVPQPHQPLQRGNSNTGEQLELFGQLQSVVVQLSQAAVSEKSKIVQMQKRLDSYEVLVKEQDRMIEDLRAMNACLQKERDALSAFRHPDGNSCNDSFTARRGGSPSASHMFHHDELMSASSVATPKTRTFVQSLVDQLKEEKRLRFQVEEQSSRMIGEQQLTIHRLEDRLVRNNFSSGMAPPSPGGTRSPRASIGRQTAQLGQSIATVAPAPVSSLHRASDDAMPVQHSTRQHGGSTSTAMDTRHVFTPLDPRAENPSPSDDPSVASIRMTADDGLSSRSASAEGVTGGGGPLSMESAALLLEQIKRRHGL